MDNPGDICVAWKNNSSLVYTGININHINDIIINGIEAIIYGDNIDERYDDFFGIRGYYTTNYIITLHNFVKDNFKNLINVIKNNTQVLEKHPFFLLNKEVPEEIKNKLNNFKFISIERPHSECIFQ